MEKDSINASVKSIQTTQDSLSTSIKDLQDDVNESQDKINDDITTLTKRVDATMTAEEVDLAISEEVAKGTSKVVTTTGFKFDETGLTVSKSDTDISTNINEDGMIIKKGGQQVLTANNTGVEARNLHATTYLIIGTLSRFEDYNGNRTGCFWIGG